MRTEQHRTSGARGRELRAIEREVDIIRQDMSDTLMQLERKLSPHDVVSQLASQITRGGRGLESGSLDLFKNLGGAVRDNPVSLILLATGVASLLGSERRRGARDYGPKQASEELSEEPDDTLESEGESMREKASTFARDAKQSADRFQGRMRERSSELKQQARERATRLQGRARESAYELRDRGSELAHEEPMIVIGAGLMLGAILGAAFPSTEPERRIAGPMAKRTFPKIEEHEGQERVQSARGGRGGSAAPSMSELQIDPSEEPPSADPTDLPIDPEEDRGL